MSLEELFDEAMRQVYRQAKEKAGYNATRFLQMLDEHGGLETARILLRSEQPSTGLFALWEAGHLDVSMEAVVTQPEWSELFTYDEVETARRRLDSLR